MRIFLGLLLFFIIIFIFCCCRVAHEADEDDIHQGDGHKQDHPQRNRACHRHFRQQVLFLWHCSLTCTTHQTAPCSNFLIATAFSGFQYTYTLSPSETALSCSNLEYFTSIPLFRSTAVFTTEP